MSDIADFENMMSLDAPIKSSAPTRWERKQATASAGPSSSSSSSSDRFIPNRSGMDRKLVQQSFCEDSFREDADNHDPSEYAKMLAACSGNDAHNDTNGARVLAFKNKAPAPKDGYQSSLKVLYSQQGAKKSDIVKPTRHIPSAPVRILDAPDLVDDYCKSSDRNVIIWWRYSFFFTDLNLMSWSSSNVLAIALSQTVYLWDAASGGIKELMTLPEEQDYVSSVSFVQQGGNHVAIGTASNVVQLWDVQAGKQIRSMRGHSARVGALAWNSHMLTSGSKDTTILNHDVRIQNHVVGSMHHHTQEVCGLAWSPDGSFLASGANDNTLCIYDHAATLTQNAPVKHMLTEHQAAVKALAWSPHERNLLASGGGTADRTIKFWNAASGAMVNSIDTGSQVCALQWSPFEKEILSSHGYAENQLCLWKYPTMAKVKELKGHTSRVLHMATSPDGSLVCSGAADETLRFWNIFASEGKKKQESAVLSAGGALNHSTNLKIR
jgi:cell division cycle protein 20 (cofactor of APC complex)